MYNIKNKGFSLVELIVIIAIMAILITVTTGTIINQSNKQRDNLSKIEAEELINDIRNRFIIAKEIGGVDDITINDIKNMLIEDWPNVKSFDKAGKASEKQYLIKEEMIDSKKCYTVSFILLSNNNKGKIFQKIYDTDTDQVYDRIIN